MQNYSKIALILSTSLLLNPINSLSANRTAFAMESKEQMNLIDTNDNFTLENGLIYNKGFDDIQKDIDRYNDIVQKVNERFDKIEERKRLEEQKRIEEENSYNIELIFSYYTGLAEENGGHEGINCTGARLEYGHLASNVWELGTKFETENGEIFTVSDRGGNHFNAYERVDCYIPRQLGESNSEYKRRVLNMGKKVVKVRLVKE